VKFPLGIAVWLSLFLFWGCPSRDRQKKEQQDPATNSSEEYLIEDAIPKKATPLQ